MPDLISRTAIRRTLVAISLSTLALVARAETETTATPAFEQCKQSPLGKHSFVLYEMDPPPGRAACRIDGDKPFDIDEYG